MNFKKNKYCILKNAISEELSDFIYKCFLLKRTVANTLFLNKYCSPFENIFGYWDDPQVPNTFCIYGDPVMETLLVKMLPLMQEATKLKLTPNYTFARIYKKGDILDRHKDRFSCEISTTLNLGGDNWPIYLSPKENVGIPDGKKITKVSNAKGIKVNLNPGDMLVYKGNEIEHWREEFKGENCGQVFLHYNDVKTKGADKNIFDTRPHLGLPDFFKNEQKK